MINYTQLQGRVDRLLQRVGMPVQITRADTSVGRGSAVFVDDNRRDQTSTLSSFQAQTEQTARQLVVTGILREIQVGDTVRADNRDWYVKQVKITRPTTTTLLYELEVL